MTTVAPEFIWEKATDREVKNIPLNKIHVPPDYERKDSPREDDALANSIRRTGVEQPIHVIADGKEFTLVKGTRRLAISYLCRYPTIPAIIEPQAPEGVDPITYRNRLRFHLSIRQDLKPTQQAEFILQTMKEFGMNQREIARYIGCDAGTITNVLAIKNYIPEIREAIDRNDITRFHGRSFDGLNPDGQKTVWKALGKQIAELSGHQAHRLVRTKFSPERYPQYYTAPEKTIQKLSRKSGKRTARKRPRLTKSEKEVLASDLDLKETELRDLEGEIRDRKRINIVAGKIVAAILRSEKISALLPKSIASEFEAFPY